MKQGKEFPFGLHVLPKAIMFYHMNQYKLSWVILSFAEWWFRSRKVLVIYRSFSLRTHCFASLKMSGMSITYSGYWYPPSPDDSPHNKTRNLHSESIHLEWSIQEMIPSNNSILMEYGSSSLKKIWNKKKRDKTHTSTQESSNKELK